MGIAYNPRTITDGLVLCLDAANTKSYPGSGTTWTDLSGNGNHHTITESPPYNSANLGRFTLDGSTQGFTKTSAINGTSSSNTVVIWYSTTDGAELWIRGNQSNGTYLSASSGNNYYHSNVGSPTNWVDLKSVTNPVTEGYRDGNYHMWEAKSVDFSSWTYYEWFLYPSSWQMAGNVSCIMIYNRNLTVDESKQNYNALKGRYEKGGIGNPFSSPTEARILGYTSGDYYFKSGSMSSPQLLEFQRDYYENRGWVCVFRSPYASTSTTNRIDLNIPMGGLLVQRDALDLRGAVYWSTPITYNTVGGAGNNTADSGTGYAGSNARRVILGGSGGHGIYRTDQNQCSWGNSTGAIGAGWDGSNCGSFPNGLIWGTGNASPAYENRSGIWSHWITWN